MTRSERSLARRAMEESIRQHADTHPSDRYGRVHDAAEVPDVEAKPDPALVARIIDAGRFYRPDRFRKEVRQATLRDGTNTSSETNGPPPDLLEGSTGGGLVEEA